jgi:hypothetical protein
VRLGDSAVWLGSGVTRWRAGSRGGPTFLFAAAVLPIGGGGEAALSGGLPKHDGHASRPISWRRHTRSLFVLAD